MTRASVRFATLAKAAALALSACSFDTNLPDMPQLGGVKGVLDVSGSNGQYSAGGNTVTLVDDSGAKTTQTTGDDGSFVFDGLKPGYYYVLISLPPAPKLTVPSIHVRSGLTYDLGTLAPDWPVELTAVSGTVVVNGGGNPAGGNVDFIAEASGNKVSTAIIALDGTFNATIGQGTYTLKAVHPFYVTGQMQHVVVGAGTLMVPPITMDRNPATLTGMVQHEVDGVPPTYVAAQGVTITLSDGSTGTSLADGSFTLTGLAAGTYTVELHLTHYNDSVIARPITLQPGQTATLPPVELALARYAITGIVVTGDQQPATDITVGLNGTRFGSTAVQDATKPYQAVFNITGVPFGSYEVDAVKAHYGRAVHGGVNIDMSDVDLTPTPITLTLLQGDFLIDDGDPNNTPGYTRTPNVTLDFSGFGSVAQIRASEDPHFVGVSYSPFGNPMVPFMLGAGEGSHTVYAQYKDGSGTESQVFSASIVLDTTPPAMPSIVIDSGGAFTKTANPLFLTLQAADSLSGLSLVRLNDDGMATSGVLNATPIQYQRDTSFTRSSSADGPVQVYAQFVDNAGNVSAIVNAGIVVDTAPPTGSIMIADGALATQPGYTNSALVTLGELVGAEPNGGSVLIKLANSQGALASSQFVPVAASSAWFLDPTADGVKTVYAVLQDSAGNLSTGMLSATITYDSTPPSPVTATLMSPGVTSSSNITLNLTAMDNFGMSPSKALTVSEDPFFQSTGTLGPEAMPMNGQTAFTVSSQDGPKQVFVRFRDRAGNDSSASVQLTLDTTPPTGSMTVVGTLAEGSASSSTTSSALVTVQLVQSGASSYFLTDEAPAGMPPPCPASGYAMLTTSNIGYSLSTAGQRRVRLCLQDQAGNTAGPFTQLITLDSTAPSGCAVTLTGRKVDGSAAPAGKTATASVTAAITGCTENPTDIFFTSQAVVCNAATSFAWQGYAASAPVQLPGPDGANTLRGCVRDAAHNVGSLTAGSITLDTLPPQSPSVVLESGQPYVNQATVTARGGYIGVATGTAVGATLWAASATPTPGAFVAFTSPQTANVTFPSMDGADTAYAYFQDDVGNTTVAVTANVTFDTAAPSIAGALLTLNPGGNGFTRNTAVTLQLAAPPDATQMRLANAAGAACAASDFTGIMKQPFSPVVNNFMLAGADGVKRVCLELSDAAGNAAAFVSNTITLDRAAPAGCTLALLGHKVDGSAAPAGKTASTSATVSVSGCGEVPVDISLSTTALTCVTGASLPFVPYASTLPFTLAGPDGANTAYACVRDAAGNVGSATAASITLDTQPPTAPTLTVEGGAAYFNQAQFTLRGGYKLDVQGSATGAYDWQVYEVGGGAFNLLPAPSPNLFAVVGEGTHRIYAVFRDDVGNATAPVSASIVVDTVPPTSAFTLALQPGGNGFTNSVSVQAQLQAASGATQMQVGPAATPGTCVAGDLAAVSLTPFTALPFNVLLASGDGLKTQCAKLWDDAGNSSGIVRGNITLDTTPPTVPIITTPDTLLGIAAWGAGGPRTILTSGPVTEANFARYEQVGGTQSSWTQATNNINTTAFTFTLVTNNGLAAGQPNLLQLRAVDLAGNVSPAASVTFTVDTSPPTLVTMDTRWVTNLDRQGEVFWQPSASPDVVGYNVYYGTASGVYTGSFASEGASPVLFGNVTHATLSGLINAAQVYVQVKPVDHAGNEGGAPFVEAVMQPNTVSPDYMGSVPLTYPARALARSESTLYVLEQVGSAPNAGIALQAVDLSTLVSPIQGGKITAASLPVATTAQTFNDGLPSYVTSLIDVQVDGNYLFTADGSKVRIFDLSVPLAPVLIDTITLTGAGSAEFLQVRGNTLFVGGIDANGCTQGGTTAIDLTALFDQNAATRPTVCGIAGYGLCIAPNVNAQIQRTSYGECSGNSVGGLMWTRNNVVEFETGSDTWNVASILNRSAPTFTLQGGINDPVSGIVYPYAQTDGVQSGNLAYVSGFSNFLIVNLKTVWSGASSFGNIAPAVNLGYSAGSGFEVLGGEIFVSDSTTSGFRVLGLDSLLPTFTTQPLGVVHTPASPGAIAHWGNYLAVADSTQVDLYEAATPRSIHAIAQSTLEGQQLQLSGSFLYSMGGVLDLEGGSPSTYTNLTYLNVNCSWAQAYIDDYEVTAQGSHLIVTSFENAIDRDNSTAFDSLQEYSVPLPANVFATGIATWGNYLVTAERHTAGTTGTYLHVLDSRHVRGRTAATLCNKVTPCVNGDDLGSLPVTANLPASGRADLTIYEGRAFVSIDGAGQGVYIVDLRNAFDDSSTTLASAPAQGTIALANSAGSPHGVVVQGHYAYIPTDRDVQIVDVSPAMDENAGTVMGGSPPRAAILANNPRAVDVHGSYLIIAAAFDVEVWDVSNPLLPTELSSTPYGSGSASCSVDGVFLELTGGVAFHGTRAYVTNAAATNIFELE
jgi:hypothetical protein